MWQNKNHDLKICQIEFRAQKDCNLAKIIRFFFSDFPSDLVIFGVESSEKRMGVSDNTASVATSACYKPKPACFLFVPLVFFSTACPLVFWLIITLWYTTIFSLKMRLFSMKKPILNIVVEAFRFFCSGNSIWKAR